MPKASLLDEDERDQLLKEMAYGIPVEELAKKFGLKPIQVEYQRGNNSALYNMYLDFFSIKEEIIMMELPEIYQFVLNLLWDKIKVLPNCRYEYKGKQYKIHELIPFANKILEREGLPLVELGKPVRVRYSLKKPEVVPRESIRMIKRMKFISETLGYKTTELDSRALPILELLKHRARKVSWKDGIIVDPKLSKFEGDIKLWYRILIEGRNRVRANQMTEVGCVFRVLNSLHLLSSNLSKVRVEGERCDLIFSDTLKILPDTFEFGGYSICRRIENFIDTYGVGADQKFLLLFCHLGARINDSVTKEDVKLLIENILDKDQDYIDRKVNEMEILGINNGVLKLFEEK